MSCEDHPPCMEENIQYFNLWPMAVSSILRQTEKIMKRIILIAGLALSIFSAAAVAADKRPMTVDDLFRFQRVSDPQISPDGKTVAYVVGTVDLSGNKTSSSIWLTPA